MIPYKGTYKVTQPYKGKDHQGVDLVGITSKKIYAPVSGWVVANQYDTYPDGGMGLYVKIFGKDRLYHLLGHMSISYPLPNTYVKEGDIIGVEGNSGHSFGSHCHYEIRKTILSNSFIDVCEYMNIPNKIGTYESEVNMDFKESLDLLVEKKVISSPDYWEMCAKTTMHIEELIINMAKEVLK